MKKCYFTMKTANEIPDENRRKEPGYLPGMNIIAKKYKNVVIAFRKTECGNFHSIETKYGGYNWRKDWLRESMQLEFGF